MTEGKFQTIYTFCFVAKAIILTAAKVPVPTSLGCYQDNPYQSPVLSGLATSATKMTVQGCLAFCRSSEHRYAGVVNRYGCRCGNGFQGDTVVSRRLPDSDCTAPCGGDKSQFCGGPSGSQKIEVFEASIGACGGDLNNDRGTIYSPDFPGPYSPNQNCTWNIQVHSENVVRVTLELSELSPDDVLQIRECGSSQRRVKHLNWSPDTEYISGSNVISIQFRTKPQGEQLRRGFILHYEAVGHCEAISNDAHVGSVSPSLALIGQRVTVTCKDGRAVAVECQENRRFDVQGPYCTETGSFQLQVSTIVSGTVATVLLISCIVNAFFVFRRRRGRRLTEDSEMSDHDYEEIPDVLEMKNIPSASWSSSTSTCEFPTIPTGADYQELIPVTIGDHDYTRLALNSTLARVDETTAGRESDMENLSPISASSSSELLATDSERDYQVLIPETTENNDYTSLAWDSSIAREDETTAGAESDRKFERRFGRCYDNLAQVIEHEKEHL